MNTLTLVTGIRHGVPLQIEYGSGNSPGSLRWYGPVPVVCHHPGSDPPERCGEIPCGIYADIEYDGIPGIFGNHMNFLRAGRRLFVPAYNVPSDDRACDVLRKHLPGCEVVPVRVSTLAHFGGSFNCVTWGVY